MRAPKERFDFVHEFVSRVFVDDLHAKRILSLANGTLGVMTGAALAVSLIGQALATARGLIAKSAIKQVDRLLLEKFRGRLGFHTVGKTPQDSCDYFQRHLGLAPSWHDFVADETGMLAFDHPSVKPKVAAVDRGVRNTVLGRGGARREHLCMSRTDVREKQHRSSGEPLRGMGGQVDGTGLPEVRPLQSVRHQQVPGQVCAPGELPCESATGSISRTGANAGLRAAGFPQTLMRFTRRLDAVFMGWYDAGRFSTIYGAGLRRGTSPSFSVLRAE